MNLFVANWKMNMTRGPARLYAAELSRLIGERAPGVELVLAPPLTALDAARDPKGRWSLAAQNISSEVDGAFTGEVSARMVADAGCRYVIVGHSERRRLFGERDEILARKLSRAREASLTPIYCLGETGEERARGLAAATLVKQVEVLRGDPPDAPLVVAYEPVWAIGTGLAATREDAGAAARQLAKLLSTRRDLRVLYGGSVTVDNAAALLDVSGVDGFLIGGSCLEAAAFAAIAGFKS